jgi:hypothetical protein
MSDTFRKQYRELNEAEERHIEKIKDAAERLEQLISSHALGISYAQSRCIELARTNLEQAVMWAVKAAT